jgi:hypothetical protein
VGGGNEKLPWRERSEGETRREQIGWVVIGDNPAEFFLYFIFTFVSFFFFLSEKGEMEKGKGIEEGVERETERVRGWVGGGYALEKIG